MITTEIAGSEAAIASAGSAGTESSKVKHYVKQLFSGFILFDLALIGIPALMLFPLFRLAHLPLRIDAIQMAGAFFGGTYVSSAFTAILLMLIAFPPHQTVGPFMARFRAKKGFVILALALLVALSALFGVGTGSMVTFVSLGVAELLERKRHEFESTLLDLFVPAFFLLVGVTLAFAFNHGLAGLHNPQSFDPLFDHLDAVLFHANASEIAHASLRHLPLWFYKLLELVYYSLYARIVAVLVICSLLADRAHSMKFVRAIVMCYTIALVVYAILPAKGPYSTCILHESTYPHSLVTYWTQQGLASRAHLLWIHNVIPTVLKVVPEDYYISFPSLHVALPIIAVWFARPWKTISRLLLALFVFLMLPAILLLEWHYIVDFFGGFGTAALSIWLTERISTSSVAGESLTEIWARWRGSRNWPEGLVKPE